MWHYGDEFSLPWLWIGYGSSKWCSPEIGAKKTPKDTLSYSTHMSQNKIKEKYFQNCYSKVLMF